MVNSHLLPLHTSDAHFYWSPVIDWLKSPKTDCSNSHQDLGPIIIKYSSGGLILLFLWCCGQAYYCFPAKFKPQTVQNAHVLAEVRRGKTSLELCALLHAVIKDRHDGAKKSTNQLVFTNVFTVRTGKFLGLHPFSHASRLHHFVQTTFDVILYSLCYVFMHSFSLWSLSFFLSLSFSFCLSFHMQQASFNFTRLHHNCFNNLAVAAHTHTHTHRHTSPQDFF